jgi:hypothetical protein
VCIGHWRPQTTKAREKQKKIKLGNFFFVLFFFGFFSFAFFFLARAESVLRAPGNKDRRLQEKGQTSGTPMGVLVEHPRVIADVCLFW